MRKLIHSDRGQAIVETALVMPILLLLLFGILDAGRVFYAWIIVTNGAREGARVGATHRPESEILDRVDAAMGGMNPADYDVTIVNAQGDSGDPIEVTVEGRIELVTPLIQAFFPTNPVTLTNTATMRLE
ncbi:MAG: TadE/TadG family type IV pilus assembly protein [Dehalococcoidia bacterium]